MTKTLPNFEFFTGVPGSRWSGIAQQIKLDPAYNTSDRATHRVYTHGEFSGHKDAYFGTGMEFSTNLDQANLEAPFTELSGIKLLMSHEWPYHFKEIIERYPDAWITLIYRNDIASLKWWQAAGGFNITYPNYAWYESDHHLLSTYYVMTERIKEQNQLILDFAQKHSVQWLQHHTHSDIFIGTYKS
jgi:hypothetical protein